MEIISKIFHKTSSSWTINRKIRILLLETGLIFLISFLSLSYFVNEDVFRSIDFNTMIFLQKIILPSFDVPLSLFTPLGSAEVTTLILFMVAAFIFIRRRKLLSGSLLFFVIVIIELFGKLIIFHPKPPVIFYRYALGVFFPSSYIVQTAFSFPSGHMARSSYLLSLILILVFISKKRRSLKQGATILTFLFFLGMFISRIYLGEHWLSDALGGLLLGISISCFSVAFW